MLLVEEGEENGREIANLCGKWNEDCDLVLMQYTGLKDKNGVEIYEGDIIKFYFDDGYDEIRGTEYFSCIEDYTKELIVWGNQLFGSEGVEVIGNIYENEDLLKMIK